MLDVSTPAFWNDRYGRGADGWDLGGPALPLQDFLATTPPPRGRVAVPGCGRGHDARLLARHGYEVTGFDFSTPIVREAERLARADGVDVRFVERDVFSLSGDYAHAFDGAWEYTCYCAIDPRRRPDYLATLGAIIRPGGWLLACFFPLRGAKNGPPFPVSRAELARRLSPRFRVVRAFPPLRSARGRQGREWMVLAQNVC